MHSSPLRQLAGIYDSIGRSIENRWRPVRHKILETVTKNGLLGFICFGGPPVHFQIFHKRFVEKYQWVEESMYQELFAVTQALSGPGSTKMLYCINLNRNGSVAAAAAFLMWSLPGALGMYGLSLGISNVSEVLPAPVYALLSGFNAATVGIIALAAVQLSNNAITDPVTRILVFLGATAGMLYNALWYFPVLLLIAGTVTVVWDFRWLHPLMKIVEEMKRRIRRSPSEARDAETNPMELQPHGEPTEQRGSLSGQAKNNSGPSTSQPEETAQINAEEIPEPRVVPPDRELNVSWKFGTALIVGFLATFTIIMVLRGTLKHPPILFSMFSNLYLAGTIIFGGGPVVIPLLRQYIVAEGWVSSRDFLLGLALIQTFPGPNFNFAVYLGSLTAINASLPSAAGAIIAYIAIFAPGLILVHGTMGLWKALRTHRWVKSALRGINAAAVGLIYTAVYRLWQIGYLDEDSTSGSSLGRDPWWVVVAATSFVGGRWFGLPVPVAIMLGGVMGLIWYGVTSS